MSDSISSSRPQTSLREPATASMRVLLVAATFPPTRCGVADYSLQLCRQLQALGHEVHVLTGSALDPEHQHTAPESMGPVGAATTPEPTPLPDAESRNDALFVYRAVDVWDWQSQNAFVSALEHVRPQVVSLQYHGEDFLLHPAVCMFAERARDRDIPVVTTFHNLQKPRGWTHGREPLEWLLETSERWITTNALDQREMAEIPGAATKLRLVPTGANIAAPQVHPPVHRDDQELQVAYFGFLNPVKGIEYLLQAMALLRDERLAVRLTLAAGIHTDATPRLRDYAQYIEHEIDRLQLAQQVERVGFLEEADLSQLLLRTDLAVFPFRDGLSNKNCSFWTTLEHGTPTLTTQGDGLPEGLVHENNVLLSPVDDAVALASRIRWAHAHRQLLQELGRAGQRYVRDNLSWEELAQQIGSILRECLQEETR